MAGSAVERVECIGAMIARADPRSPIPLARSARPRLGTMGQVGRSRNAQTADSRALRLRNPCREKVSPPVPVPASFQRSSHRHVDARDPQLHLPSTVYKQILPPFEAAGPRLHVDVDRPVTTASSGSPTIDPSRPGTRSYVYVPSCAELYREWLLRAPCFSPDCIAQNCSTFSTRRDVLEKSAEKSSSKPRLSPDFSSVSFLFFLLLSSFSSFQDFPLDPSRRRCNLESNMELHVVVASPRWGEGVKGKGDDEHETGRGERNTAYFAFYSRVPDSSESGALVTVVNCCLDRAAAVAPYTAPLHGVLR